MIRDIAELEDRLQVEVCIVGSGAAGLTLARALAGAGLAVAVLEGGGAGYETRTQELYRTQNVGLAHGGSWDGRARVFGGTTTMWAGQALPLADIDFERRTWVQDSGWPISPELLHPYYRRACEVMRVGTIPRPGDPDPDRPGAAFEPAFDPDLLVPITSRFSPTPNFATTHRDWLQSERRTTIVFHANVTELVTDSAGESVDYVVARSLSGVELRVSADIVVLCAGGIETARLLLTSTRHTPAGIGNGFDLVGRYFQDHPGLVVGRVHARRRKNLSDAFRPRASGSHGGQRVKYQPLFRISEGLQRRDRLLNAGGSVLFGAPSAPNSITAGKLLARSVGARRFGREERAAARLVLRRPTPLLAAAWRYAVAGDPPVDLTSTPVLAIGGEQAPNRDSRVRLTEQRDVLGMPRIAVDWRLTGHEPRTWNRFAEVAATEFERTGLGTVEIDIRLPDDLSMLSGVIVDAFHHIGTTRMADDPRSGVVDSDCRVFGIENLYVASSSVFPTGGFSNPTLTIIALALRLADHLTGRCAPDPTSDHGEVAHNA